MREQQKRITALILTIIMIFSNISPLFAIEGSNTDEAVETESSVIYNVPADYSESVNILPEPEQAEIILLPLPGTITGNGWSFTGAGGGVLTLHNGANVIIRMHPETTHTTNRIVVNGNVTAELDNVVIGASPTTAIASTPILLNTGADLNLFIRGTNVLRAGGGGAGIGGAAGGSAGGAGGHSGNITINGGRVTAQAGGTRFTELAIPAERGTFEGTFTRAHPGNNVRGAAGIGGGSPTEVGASGGNAYNITINRGRVRAYGTGQSAGIGGGGSIHNNHGAGGRLVGTIYITGGYVTATGSGNGACIGGGGAGNGSGIPGTVNQIFISPGTHVDSLRWRSNDFGDNGRCNFADCTGHFVPHVGPGSNGPSFLLFLPNPPFTGVYFDRHFENPRPGHAWVTFDLADGSFGYLDNPRRPIVPAPQEVLIGESYVLNSNAPLNNREYPRMVEGFPAQPFSRPEHTFNGWFPPVGTHIRANTTITAVWRMEGFHSVVFDYMGNAQDVLLAAQVNDPGITMPGPFRTGGGTAVQNIPISQQADVHSSAHLPVVFNHGWESTRARVIVPCS
ncbi:MAG: hypothetical protein FWE27_04990 [Defluviitaleaceae bacterium]|nr:hypothetical protein [Defluviitaleaceae bacterium]